MANTKWQSTEKSHSNQWTERKWELRLWELWAQMRTQPQSASRGKGWAAHAEHRAWHLLPINTPWVREGAAPTAETSSPSLVSECESDICLLGNQRTNTRSCRTGALIGRTGEGQWENHSPYVLASVQPVQSISLHWLLSSSLGARPV